MDDQTDAEVEATQEESQEDAATVDDTEDNASDENTYDPEKAREKIRKINSENRNLRKRAADAEAKAQEAAGTSEKVTQLEAENLRLRIAVKHGLPEALVKRLTGTTEEEILQDAEELMELFGPKAPPTNRPKEKLRSPGDPSGVADIDVEKIVQKVFEN